MTNTAPERISDDCPRCAQDTHYGCSCTSQEMTKFLADKLDALRAENERLRLALEEIRERDIVILLDPVTLEPTGEKQFGECAFVANEALAQEPSE